MPYLILLIVLGAGLSLLESGTHPITVGGNYESDWYYSPADDLGRIVIPRDVRRQLHFREGDPLELFIEKNGVLFKKYSPITSINDILNELRDAVREEEGIQNRAELLVRIKELGEFFEESQQSGGEEDA